MTPEEIAESLGAEIVGRQQEDGSWLCDCGKSCGSDMMLYMHRRYDHCQEAGS